VPIILHAGSTARFEMRHRIRLVQPRDLASSVKFLKIVEWTARSSPTASKTSRPRPPCASGSHVKPPKQDRLNQNQVKPDQRPGHEIPGRQICMNSSGKNFEDQDRTGATRLASSHGKWWRRGLKLGGLLAFLSPKKPGQRDTLASSAPLQTRNWARSWIAIVALLLVCIPIAAILLGYLRRPALGRQETSSGPLFGDSSGANGAKQKPAAGKPFPPPTEEPPALPVPAPPVPAAGPAPVPPRGSTQTTPSPHNPSTPSIRIPAPAPALPAQPPVVPVSPTPSVVPETFPARHDKHFGEECSGQLTLNATGLVFNCPGDSDETLRVTVNEIASADDNGIRLTSGKKYHFTIPGMSKDAQKALFRNWFTRVR
jgi:hypothetical protein